LCKAAGIDPNSRIGEGRGHPAWIDYRAAARTEQGWLQNKGYVD
jgi:tRNA-splicing ligase RtcB